MFAQFYGLKDLGQIMKSLEHNVAKISPPNCTNTQITGKRAFFFLFFLKHNHQSHNLINLAFVMSSLLCPIIFKKNFYTRFKDSNINQP